MPNWSEILIELTASGLDFDGIRRKYLAELSTLTGRNVIAYYSGWLQKPELNPRAFSINDSDMNGFMSTINKLDRSKGLDLILHTPGGEINATEAIVSYLRYAFNGNIRAIVPQIAMSGGTMIALACSEILMGMQSSLGPIDPQVNGAPAHAIRDEFAQAKEDFRSDPRAAQVWGPILQKYAPTLLGGCLNAIQMAEQIVAGWLTSGMLRGESDATDRAKKILDEFGSHQKSLNHGRHFNFQRVLDSGVKVTRLEDNQPLQDAVLSVHHCFTHTLSGTATIKIIENQIGSAFVQFIHLPGPPAGKTAEAPPGQA